MIYKSINQFSNELKKKQKVLFFGSDAFPVDIISKIHSNLQDQLSTVENLQIVTHTKKDFSKKVSNPVEAFANTNGLAIHRPIGKSKDKSLIRADWANFAQSSILNREDASNKFDIGVVCSFGYLIPSFIFQKFNNGMLVIHPSLLPRHRGATPIQHSLLTGDTITGNSFIEISQNFDSGNILLQTQIDIPPSSTYQKLQKILSTDAGNHIMDVIDNIQEKKLQSVPQGNIGTTPAPKFKLEDTLIDWHQQNSLDIYRKFLAFYGTHFTSIRTQYKHFLILIEEAELPTSEQNNLLKTTFSQAQPSSIWVLKEKQFQHNIYVKCATSNNPEIPQFLKIKAWRPIDRQQMGAYTFRDQFIETEKLFTEAQTTSGLYFFSKKSAINP